jgi:hypothetical protein
VISSVEGYQGMYVHNWKLKVGDEQKMIFLPEDKEPQYWMMPKEREQTRKDQYGLKMIQKEYTKPQLLIEMLKRERSIASPK